MTEERYRRLFDLSGRNALVLGAASGIGKASAETLAGLGARVICADRDAEGARATASAIGAAAEAVVTDAAGATDIDALADVVRRRGRLDIALTTPAINIR